MRRRQKPAPAPSIDPGSVAFSTLLAHCATRLTVLGSSVTANHSLVLTEIGLDHGEQRA